MSGFSIVRDTIISELNDPPTIIAFVTLRIASLAGQMTGQEHNTLNPVEAVTSVFRNFVNFNGRARRSEFWWFVLFAFVSQLILNFLPIVGTIYSLVLVLPSLAVTARRLHDTNRTAWWMLLYLVPVRGVHRTGDYRPLR